MPAPIVTQTVLFNICPGGSDSPMEQHTAQVTHVVTGDFVDLLVEDPLGGTYVVEFVDCGTTQGFWQEV